MRLVFGIGSTVTQTIVPSFIAAASKRTRVSALHGLKEGLRHLYQMTRLVGVLVVREGKRSVFAIAQTMIKRGQFGPQVHNRQIHEAAACGAAIVFGGGDHARSKTGTLQCGFDREQAKISAIVSQLDVNASG